MNCQKCKIEIEERGLGLETLSDAARGHLSACAECRVFGEERFALRRLVGELGRVSAPADFDFRMRARMAAERSERAPRVAARFNFSPAALSWPLAACVTLLISASLYFQTGRPDDATLPTLTTEQTRAATPSPQTIVAQQGTPSPQSLEAEQATPADGSARREASRGVVDVASSKSSPAQRRRVASASRFAARTGVEREAIRVEESTSVSLTGATPRFSAGGTARNEGILIPVQLGAPEGQLKVLLRDTSGGARTISVDSVSFGSRDVMGRSGETYTKASLSTNQGVW
ncbi:MAG TPA: hypothetical protein VEY11_08795 [Pyrinomonadaceae bacterium]|nr:hypothetical protein [Pyrinomonadaceae bacterium]